MKNEVVIDVGCRCSNERQLSRHRRGIYYCTGGTAKTRSSINANQWQVQEAVKGIYFIIITSVGSSRWLLKDYLLVIPCFSDTLKNVFLRFMQQLFLWHPSNNIHRAPPFRSFLQATHIQYSMAEMIVDFRVRLFPQKGLVRMHCIPCQ